MTKRFAKATRELAMRRADWRCEKCGTDDGLTLHHLDPGRNDLTNAVVLCTSCHWWQHHTRYRHHKPNRRD
jgi:hypothetical protein